MPSGKTQPIALTIAGSDSGGGAGIQADLKTFAALGVHGASAVTCLTAQNPKGVLGLQPCRPEMVRRQMDAVFAELPPAAVKTGMLLTAGIVRVVAEFFRPGDSPPLVVDPVITATSGARLLRVSAIRALRGELLPLAALVTPNLAEAEVLTGLKLRDVSDMRAAARALRADYGCAVLIKGGHLRGGREACDVFWDGRTELLLTAPFVRGVSTHGTGCAFSAAAAGYAALGCALPKAVQKAKDYVTQAIAQSTRIGSHWALGHFWNR
jgi:hydroxymethylpyrimidine kinase/phosphomethylpyrimidine kinase